ncbi:hypothetical protein TRFO_22781 [Tritrichomonas foetus]|uniref:Beige/BEACH domain containing protein n=1 Tax=Tritrichomonas foetus TaxID=1144522 RepID=A0A1J4KB09_9EUKA|nr:hypothetical protein TRFO_22781 [Tritrichomonas foetus]|eukprot:OHT08601.1 hypothetical protein TRFO_22781 [Tritrichomonas foetus]
MNVVKRFFNKDGNHHTEFEEMVVSMNSRSSTAEIEACAISYNESFSRYKPDELIQCPIKKEADKFLTLMIPKVTKLLGKNQENDHIFRCLESISYFLPTQKDISDELYQLTIRIISSNIQSILNSANKILQNFTMDKRYTEYMIKKSFLEVYGVGKSCGPPISSISFNLLKSCINRSKIAPDSGIIEIVNSNFNLNSGEHLILIASIYLFSGQQPNFDIFNKQIHVTKNCFCYEFLFKINKEEATIKFTELSRDVDDELGKSIILFYVTFCSFLPTLEIDFQQFLPYIGSLDSTKQNTFLTKIKQKMSDNIQNIIKSLLPPWKYRIDGNVLLKFIVQNCDKDKINEILRQILQTQNKNDLNLAFISVHNFSKFIIGLFHKIIDSDAFTANLTAFALIIVEGSNESVDCFIKLLSEIDPILYKDILIKLFPHILKSEIFSSKINDILAIPLLSGYLLNNKLIFHALKHGYFDFISLLVKDEPHEEIDKIIIKYFDKTKLKDLNQTQLTKLSLGLSPYGREMTGCIKIPSLIPKITQVNLTSLYDKYFAGKYLIERNLVNPDDKILSTIGVQFLTSKFASALLEKPSILREVTDPSFPHQSVYQIESQREKAFILVCDTKFTFYFRIDHYEKPFIILDIINPIVTYINNQINICGNSYPCELKKWHKLSVILSSSGVDITFDSKIKSSSPHQGPATIGCRTAASGSTFYVKAPLEFQARVEPGVLVVDYRGFLYHAPYINAIPRIFKAMVRCDNKADFDEYFNSLLNIHIADSSSRNNITFISFLREIIIIKSEFVTEDIIQILLTSVSNNGKIDWTLFRAAFIDYKLWAKLQHVLSPVCIFLQNYLLIEPPSQPIMVSLSLYHFFVDLALFIGIESDLVFKTIHVLSKFEEDKMSAFVIHFLNKDPPPVIRYIVEQEPSLLDSIPIELLRFTCHDFALIYLNQYARRCYISDNVFDFDRLMSLMPLFETLVTNENFWTIMLSLLCRSMLPNIHSFRRCQIHRHEMLSLIFHLLCIFFQQDPKNIILELLADVIESIISDEKNKKINLTSFIDNIRELLHFGITENYKVIDPILFNNEIEPCRMPTENSGLQTLFQARSIIEHDSKCKQSGIFFNSADLWFGLKSKDFDEVCDQELQQIYSGVKSGKSKNHNLKISKDAKINTKSGIYKTILRIAAACLMQLRGEKMQIGLHSMLIFGANVNPEISLTIQQDVIFSILSLSNLLPDLLPFIKMMVVSGWWENKLPELFRSLCTSCQKAEQNINTWNQLADVFKCILALTVDFSVIPFWSFPDVVFNVNILNNLSSLMFYFHIFLSDSFLNIPSARCRDTWGSFLLQLQHANTRELTNLLGSLNYGMDGIVQYLTNVAHSSSFFANVKLSQSSFVNTLKERAKPYYDTFIRDTTKRMEAYYGIIRNFRENTCKIPIPHDEQKSKRLFNIGVSRIENFMFEMRFNILTLRDEKDSFQLWASLPPDPPTQFMVSSSIHPISVPSLLVPFITDNDFVHFNEYGKFRNASTELGNLINVLLTEIPRCIDDFVLQPYIVLSSNRIVTRLFQSNFLSSGKITCIDDSWLIFGTVQIPCAFITCERGFHIILDAKSDPNDSKSIFINEPSPKAETLVVNTFLDICACGYYGVNRSLFFGHMVLSFTTHDILISAPREFLFTPTAAEIWFVRGYSLFLRFSSQKECFDILKKINAHTFIPSYGSCFSLSFSKKLCKVALHQSSIDEFQNNWIYQKMSTFAYLLVLNFFANRSFSCVSQYPVLPWTVPQRDLKKPMGQQDAERSLRFARKFGEIEDRYLYTQFYSSPLIVLRFMSRIQPFTNNFIEYNGKFEDPNRSFRNIENDWNLASKLSDSNVEELIPEIYILPEIYQNTNNIPFPKPSEFVLPKDVKSFPMLTAKLRMELNHAEKIENWIDLIFGVNSSGEAAVLALNVFLPSTYGKLSSLISNRKDLEQHMIDLGIAPTQLFDKEHPSRNSVISKRPPFLIDSTTKDQIISQELRIGFESIKSSKDNERFIELSTDNGEIKFINLMKLFTKIKKESLSINDGIFRWKIDESNSIKTIRFSDDKTLLACGINCGAILVYRVLSDKKLQQFSSVELISSLFVPNDYLENVDSSSLECDIIAISSHVNLVCEASGSTLYCFHISSMKFIRTIEFSCGKLNNVLISDSFEMILGFGSNQIELFTINGTKVVISEIVDSEITTSSLAVNDDILFFATGHNDGTIKLWTCDLENEKIIVISTIQYSEKPIKFIKIFKNGGALVVSDLSGRSTVYVVPGIPESIFVEKIAANCSSCKLIPQHLYECSHCHLFYCKSCSKISDKSSICNKCLERFADIV